MNLRNLSKKQKISGVAAILITALAVFLFFSLRHSPKVTPKPAPVAQAPATTKSAEASAPVPESAKADKLSALGKSAKIKGQGGKWPPPTEIKGRPVVVQAEGQARSNKPAKTDEEVIKLLRHLVDQGINVHLVGEPPANTVAEPSAETQTVQPMTYEELGKAYQKAVHEGRPLP